MNHNRSFTDIKQQIEAIFNKHVDIARVYVSIGGKYNEPSIRLSHTSLIKTKTNADLQMVPTFLRENSWFRTLVIIWDIFDNSQNFIQNKTLLDNIQARHRHISYMMINKVCDTESIDIFVPTILEILADHYIQPANFMIGNYVRFKHDPNPTERESETRIPRMIQTILNRPQYAVYQESLYQWFGYHPMLYDFIYNYKNVDKILYPAHIMSIISDLIEKHWMNTADETTVIQDQNVIQMMSNMYNIRWANSVNTNPRMTIDTLAENFVMTNRIVLND